MNQKDRLVQLLEKFGEENGVIMNLTESIAEFLSENGVIVPPCKVGDKVYCIGTPCGGCKYFNEPLTEEGIEICKACKKREIIECGLEFDLINEFGKTVFLTKEEAEKALERMREDEKNNI